MSIEQKHCSGTYPHTPNYIIPIAPGEHLKEKLEEMGMSIDRFSQEAGLPVEAVELLFTGKLPITLSLATKLETITQMPAHLWLNFERGYRENLKKAAEKYDLVSN